MSDTMTTPSANGSAPSKLAALRDDVTAAERAVRDATKAARKAGEAKAEARDAFVAKSTAKDAADQDLKAKRRALELAEQKLDAEEGRV